MSTLKGAGRDYTRASEIQIHGIEMLIKAWATHLLIYLIPALIIGTLIMFFFLSGQDVHVVLIWCRAGLMGLIPFDLPAAYGSISSHTILSNATVKSITLRVALTSIAVYGSTLMFAVFLTFQRVKKTKKAGEELSADEFIRGQKLADVDTVKQIVDDTGASVYSLGGVPLVKNAERSHTMIVGAPGTGKSVTISALLRQIRAQGDSAIIYDLAGDYIEHFYNPGRGDAILNPVDQRCANWLPWADIDNKFHCRSLSESIIPEPQGGADRYWTDAARMVLSAGFELQNNLPALLHLLLNDNLEDFANAFSGTDAAAMLNAENEKTSMSIRAVLSAYVASFRLLAAQDQSNEQLFSVRDFVKKAALQDQSRFLFVSSRADMHAAIKPLISCWLDIAIRSILSLPSDHERRVWLIVDELPSLQKIPTLADGLAQGRKHGLCGVLGLQSIAQLREIYKKDGAEAIGGLCNTWQIFRSPEPDTARWCAAALGKYDSDEVHESMSYGVEDARDGVRWERRRQERDVVMPTEIMALPDLQSYLRLPGDYPICRITVPIVQMPEVAPALIEIEQQDLLSSTTTAAATVYDDNDDDENTMIIDTFLNINNEIDTADIIADIVLEDKEGDAE